MNICLGMLLTAALHTCSLPNCYTFLGAGNNLLLHLNPDSLEEKHKDWFPGRWEFTRAILCV
jgi:hypothetical protein